MGSPVPFGFRATDGSNGLEPDERELALLARVVQLREVYGLTPALIVGTLRAEHVDPRTGRPVTLLRVRKLLAAARALARAAA